MPPASLSDREFYTAANGPHPPRMLPRAEQHGGTAHRKPIEWPRTDRPLRIAIIGWARLSSQGKEGSGYNLSKSELARGLALSGHTVTCLQSGMTYRWGLSRRRRGPHIAHREDWAGIRCFDLRNSPNIAPAAWNFRNMAEEVSSPNSTRLVLDWLREQQAQVVHIHSQEGYGLDLIGAIEDAGIPVVATLHNYWHICPQVDLLHREAEVCLDYDGGRRCVGCLEGKDVAKLKKQRATGQTLEGLWGMYPADVIRKAAYGLKPALKSILNGRFSRRFNAAPLNPPALPDPELALGFDTEHGIVTDGTIAHDVPLHEGEHPRHYHRAALDTNEKVLANREVHLTVLNEYGRRRSAGIAALNRASLVIPPSDHLRKVHVAMGLDQSRTRWVRLGQPHFDQINRRTRRSPFYDTVPWDPRAATTPLRFGYFGTTRPNKGLEVLARAIPLLATEVRQRCQFTIRAMGHEAGFKKRLSKYPEVCIWPGVGYDLLQLIGSGGDYDVGILPHIWMENSPLVMLENFHAGKFILCSRLGGPVDWLNEGPRGNGMFFPGGDEFALAACITKLVTGEVPIPTPRQIHQRTILQSYPAHVAECESIYHEVIERKVGPTAAPQPVATPAVVIREMTAAAMLTA
ncbi:MAG: glycosyltransferase [Phycisphaerales bacterium]|nr:glycosyltransferase [Phycisphaerales bacterium]